MRKVMLGDGTQENVNGMSNTQMERIQTLGLGAILPMAQIISERILYMNDIIAVKVKDKTNKIHYFLTWGRIFDNVNNSETIKVLKPRLTKFGIKNIESIKICSSLEEASKAKYFYENFFLMCQKKIPFGSRYANWKKEICRKIKAGKEIYFLG